jgi:membrane protein implicated in regulation of membrane protease activity
MEISIYAGIIWFVGILIFSLSLVIFLGSKVLSSRAFAHSILWVAIWVICVGLFVTVKDPVTGLFFCRLTYYLGNVIAASFIYFFLTYPEDKRPNNLLVYSLVITELILGYLYLFTDNIIRDVFPIQGIHPWGWYFGDISFIFEIFFFGFFIYGVFILYRKYRLCNDVPGLKTNLKFMLWAMIVGTVPASLMCIILPRFGYFNLNWLGPTTEIVWIPIITYSILKYRQMSVRMVGTEVFVITMIILAFLNIFMDLPFGIYARIGLFAVFTFLGYFLIRSLVREDQRKEQLNTLNSTLSSKVAEQTREIRHSYDLEKRARLELEKLNDAKDQFILMTQHQLRAPVSNVAAGIGVDIEGRLRCACRTA